MLLAVGRSLAIGAKYVGRGLKLFWPSKNTTLRMGQFSGAATRVAGATVAAGAVDQAAADGKGRKWLSRKLADGWNGLGNFKFGRRTQQGLITSGYVAKDGLAAPLRTFIGAGEHVLEDAGHEGAATALDIASKLDASGDIILAVATADTEALKAERFVWRMNVHDISKEDMVSYLSSTPAALSRLEDAGLSRDALYSELPGLKAALESNSSEAAVSEAGEAVSATAGAGLGGTPGIVNKFSGQAGDAAQSAAKGLGIVQLFKFLCELPGKIVNWFTRLMDDAVSGNVIGQGYDMGVPNVDRAALTLADQGPERDLSLA